MPLIKDVMAKVFDTEQIKKGDLMYAKHHSWTEGKGGFITEVKDTELIIQYHSGISNVTNHFFLPANEVATGEWEVRWSKDLKEVHSLKEGGEEIDP